MPVTVAYTCTDISICTCQILVTCGVFAEFGCHICFWYVFGNNVSSSCCSWLCCGIYVYICWTHMPTEYNPCIRYVCNAVPISVQVCMVNASDFKCGIKYIYASALYAHQILHMYVQFGRHVCFWDIFCNNMKIDVAVGILA